MIKVLTVDLISHDAPGCFHLQAEVSEAPNLFFDYWLTVVFICGMLKINFYFILKVSSQVFTVN